MSIVSEKRVSKIKWNKSQLIESDHYIRVFIKSLTKHFAPAERQEIYFISKLFVDGTVEVGNNRFESADHFFKRGEAFLAGVGERPLMKLMLTNIYDRSKSLYFYKLNEFEKAIELINHALKTNMELERMGFLFMAFDRFSQYHNLSKIYFSQNQVSKGLHLLSDVISFLMTAKANHHIGSIDNFLETLDEDGASMRSSLLAMLLFETTAKLQMEQDKGVFTERSKVFFETILTSLKNFVIISKIDSGIQQWLALVTLFYTNDYSKFEPGANMYLRSGQSFYGQVPNRLIKNYLAIMLAE